MLSNTLSTAFVASAFDMPAESETAETRSFLFTLGPPLGWFAQCLEREARIQTARSLKVGFESGQIKNPRNPGFFTQFPSRIGKKLTILDFC